MDAPTLDALAGQLYDAFYADGRPTPITREGYQALVATKAATLPPPGRLAYADQLAAWARDLRTA